MHPFKKNGAFHVYIKLYYTVQWMKIDFEEEAFLHIFVTFIFEINVFQCTILLR